MTLDQNVEKTWGKALTDVKDKIATLTNWTIEVDSWNISGDKAQGTEHYVVYSMPSPEYMKFRVNINGNGGIIMEYGSDYDTTNDNWNTQYAHDQGGYVKDKASVDYNYDGDVYGNMAPTTKSLEFGQSMAYSDSVIYDIRYADGDGFAWYCRRNENDGNDEEMFVGFAKVNRLFDYTTATSPEAIYVNGYFGQAGSYTDEDTQEGFGSSFRNLDILARGGVSDYNLVGRGRPNGADGFTDYPCVPQTVCVSDLYGGTPVGTQSIWFEDTGAGADGDVITDSVNSNDYIIRNPDGSGKGIVIQK